MTTIEKKMLVAVAIVLVGTVVLVNDCSNRIDKAGGFKQIIIDAGKEIKDISKQIDAEQ